MPVTREYLRLSALRPIDDAEFDSDWDALAGSRPESGFMQSSSWARFKRSEGYATRRYGYYDGPGLVGGALVQHYPPAAGCAGLVVCPEGPVAPWQTRPDVARNILRQLQSAVEQDFPDAIGLRIEPHVGPPRPSILRNWQRAPLDLTPTDTLMLDLTLSDDELLASMRPKGRYNVRLAERNGVTIESSISISDIQRFYLLFRETANRREFFAEPYGFFLNLAASLLASGGAKLYFAVAIGEVVSTAIVLYFGRRATYLYGGSSTVQRNQMANYLLHWTAIREARAHGCIEYDFYGYDPFGLPNHPYAGFSQFKKQFGGTVASSIGAYDCLFYDRLADRIIPNLRRSFDVQNGVSQ